MNCCSGAACYSSTSRIYGGEHDLEINIKAEEKIEVILQHLEYQNEILMAMPGKPGVSEVPADKKK